MAYSTAVSLSAMLQLLPLMLLCSVWFSINSSIAVNVFIDGNEGQNTSECVSAGSKALPCQTLEYAVAHSYNDTTFTLLSDALIDMVVHFTSRSNITITIESDKQNKQILCDCRDNRSCGLLFENCENVTLERVTVKNCSVRVATKKEVLVMRAGFIIMNGVGSTRLNHFSATENRGFGMVIFNTFGTVDVFSSNFTNNSLHFQGSFDVHGGGGLYIVVDCTFQGNTKCFYNDCQYNIIDTKFYGNHQKWSISYRKAFLHTASYGGGLGVLIGAEAKRNHFFIQKCTFEQNVAAYGGGLFVGCEHDSDSNRIEIHDSMFQQNIVSESFSGGGGVILALTSSTQRQPINNSITFYNCTFFKNSAHFGGGTSVYASKQFENVDHNKVSFNNCTWTKNSGAISPAVDLAPDFRFQDDTRFIASVSFTDCVFENNYITAFKIPMDQPVTDHSEPAIPIHQVHHNGVFLVTKFHASFNGTNQFIHNTGTALYLCSSQAKFYNYSDTYFINNTGLFGGAVSLHGFSRVNYGDNVMFHFESNRAKKGGGIFVHSIDQHLTFASYTCFLSYGTEESKGLNLQKPSNVTFDFHGNMDAYNVSRNMYLSSSVNACLYACRAIVHEKITAEQTFGNSSCLGNFTYHSSNQIAADSSMAFLIKPNNHSYVNITPGRFSQIPIKIYDSFGNDITNISVGSAELVNSDNEECQNASIDPTYAYTLINYIKILGQPTVNCTLLMTVVGSLDIQLAVNITLTWCRPGYVIKDDQPRRLGKCVCSASLDESHYRYFGISRCNSSTYSATIDPDLWVGYNISHLTQDNLYTAPCPTGYCNIHVKELNVSAASLSEFICVPFRHAFLCGSCQHGTSVYFNNMNYKCRSNSQCQFGALFYIAVELLPISAVFVFIILADIRLTSGVAYSTVFIAQMLHSVSFTTNGAIPFHGFRIVDYIYGIVDLDFPFYSFCLWKGITTLDVLVMKYVSMAYAMGLILLTVLIFNSPKCSKCCKCLLQRVKWRFSVVQGISTFLVICYSQCARVTFKILAMATASNIGSKSFKNVVLFAGHLEYMSYRHLPYAIPAILITAFVMVPLPLLLFFDPFFLKIEGFLVKHRVLVSCLPWTRFRMKFKPFFDSFQGCFRDDARYFAGLFFIYRAAIHLTSTLMQQKPNFNLFLELLLVLMLMIQSTVQPFESKWNNVLSSFMFFVFAFINSLSITNYILFVNGNIQTEILVMQWLQMILALTPLIVGIAMAGKWLLGKCCNAKLFPTSSGEFLSLRRDYGSLSLYNQADNPPQ